MITGTVIRGNGVAGATFGVPTANLSLSSRPDLTPGVYVGLSTINNETFPSLICFDADAQGKFEVHLFNVAENLYDKTLSVTIQSKISDLIPWTTEEAMQSKINDDVLKAKHWFATQDLHLSH